ncbi:MAG TPA: transcription/translation regulatory transformer protein RfaH [Methylophilaceae bacterium]|nr:transcription/translation regulatory transformer protein RfaH [Methylophilaceae bacterium]
MNWYLVHTKPRQEKTALQNLEQQGYECYLPLLRAEKIQQGFLTLSHEPLFPRYLFIRLDTNQSAKSWGPIRFTRGVNKLVSFGNEPAKINPQLVDFIKTQEATSTDVRSIFRMGEKVTINRGPFSGIEAIYQMKDGESRVIVLIEFLSKPVELRIAALQLSKTRNA